MRTLITDIKAGEADHLLQGPPRIPPPVGTVYSDRLTRHQDDAGATRCARKETLRAGPL
ncbi:hypothetical protein [Streptomyces sp. KMM 9044]|uniref:hypothetical protein n=1 Tax=Streptomyces sp. KMM 9044 TaxID=2744474 RepID=UPI003FA6BB43